MVIDLTNGALEEARVFAREHKMLESLEGQLEYLGHYAERAGKKTTCKLYKDFAPYSFGFSMLEGDKFWFSGGLIFHGAHDGGGNGGPPSFSVCLEPTVGWSVHT